MIGDGRYLAWGWVSGEDPGWHVEGSYADAGAALEAAEALIGRSDAVRVTETVWSFGVLS